MNDQNPDKRQGLYPVGIGVLVFLPETLPSSTQFQEVIRCVPGKFRDRFASPTWSARAALTGAAAASVMAARDPASSQSCRCDIPYRRSFWPTRNRFGRPSGANSLGTEHTETRASGVSAAPPLLPRLDRRPHPPQAGSSLASHGGPASWLHRAQTPLSLSTSPQRAGALSPPPRCERQESGSLLQ